MLCFGFLHLDILLTKCKLHSSPFVRITSINNSPIFADFSQTLSGTSSIRAYGAANRFSAHCEDSFDKMDASYILVQVVNQWLALRLDVLGGLVGFFIGAFAMATHGTSYAIPAGWVGLALNYSIELTGYLKFGVRMVRPWGEMRNNKCYFNLLLLLTRRISPTSNDF